MSQAPRELRSKWPLVLCVLASFIVGFGVSFVSRRKVIPPNESKIPVADFRVAIPEGETVVTISSRDPEGEELGQLTIQRRGNTISGVPQIERRIEPRARLTAEDAAYLRRELSNEISLSDSPWQRANKIREWFGKDENGKPLAGHDHAHYLPLIHDRRLTGLLVWAPWSADGLPEDELDALLKVRKLWSEDESDRLDVRPSGTGLAKALAPGLTGPALSWISATPYTPSRYAKPSHDWLDFLRDDIAHELAYRGLPPAEVSLVSGEWAAFRRYRPSAQFRHDRRQGSATKPSALLRLQFKTSVTGPIALGHLSHFGLGLFTPE